MINQRVDSFISKKKFGFIGAGNLAGFIIDGLISSGTLRENQIFVSNRSEVKSKKLGEKFPGIHICGSNDEAAENSDLVFLGMKPQDLRQAVEPMRSIFDEQHIIVSLAAGIHMEQLKQVLPKSQNIVRLMTNTPIKVRKAVVGFLLSKEDESLEDILDQMFSPLGLPVFVDSDEELDALAVACGSGPGFVFELMMIWASWLEGYGYEPEVAKDMAMMTFAGASELALENKELSLQDLQNQVTSKKGITFEGLKHLRSLEAENSLTASFEKAFQRGIALSKEFESGKKKDI